MVLVRCVRREFWSSDKCVKLKRLVVEKHKPINVAALAMATSQAQVFYQDAYDKNYVPLRKNISDVRLF